MSELVVTVSVAGSMTTETPVIRLNSLPLASQMTTVRFSAVSATSLAKRWEFAMGLPSAASSVSVSPSFIFNALGSAMPRSRPL